MAFLVTPVKSENRHISLTIAFLGSWDNCQALRVDEGTITGAHFTGHSLGCLAHCKFHILKKVHNAISMIPGHI